MTKKPMPRERKSTTYAHTVGGCKLYLVAGEYPDGTLGEISIRATKMGSTISGLMDAFATMVSLALQAGVTFEDIYDRMHGTRFEPSGYSDDPDVPDPESLVDYVFRKLWIEYGQ